jgi:hypothetical protein
MKQILLIAATILLFLTQANSAVTITSTTPTANNDDIINTSGSNAERFFTDTENVGQTFKTGTNQNGYKINGWSSRLGNSIVDGKTQSFCFNLRLVEIISRNDTKTISIEKNHCIENAIWNIGDWITWTFDNPITLDPNKLYGIDVEMVDADESENGIPYLTYSNTNVYANGYRYKFDDEDPTEINIPSGSRDRVFHIDMNGIPSVPEPSSVFLLMTSFCFLLFSRRFR